MKYISDADIFERGVLNKNCLSPVGPDEKDQSIEDQHRAIEELELEHMWDIFAIHQDVLNALPSNPKADEIGWLLMQHMSAEDEVVTDGSTFFFKGWEIYDLSTHWTFVFVKDSSHPFGLFHSPGIWEGLQACTPYEYALSFRRLSK